jgi:hypothetical protein
LCCTNVTKWSVHNLSVYKHLLFHHIPQALLTFI